MAPVDARPQNRQSLWEWRTVVRIDYKEPDPFGLRNAGIWEYLIYMTRGLILTLLIISLAACKKKETEATPPPPPAAQATDTTQATPAEPTAPLVTKTPGGATKLTPTQPVVIPENQDINATLAQLSDELRGYVSSSRSKPKDFADFAARDHLHVPPPPAGKAYAISAGQVVLVNQ